MIAGGGEPIDPSPSDPVPADPAPADPAPSEPVDYFASIPDDWRGQMLSKAGYQEGEDYEKALKQLDRVSDVGVLAKNYLSAQEKIRKGEVSNGLPENPSEEQVAAFREAHGIPATAEGYELSLEDGLVLGEADEQIMGSVYEAAHAGNVDAKTMSEITNAVLKSRQAQADARISQDGVDRQMTDQMLKDAWGGDTEVNINMVKGLVNQLPETIKESFENARLPDGKALFNSPEVMVAMAEWARKINPSATVVPNSANPMQTMNDEIAKLEARMGDDDWHRDQKANDRLESLYDARNQMSAQ
jgi:hypothetical protein